MAANEKGTHLNYEDRKIIQTGIENGSTKTSIANTIGKDNSTVGKDIALHRTLKSKCALPLECKAYQHCKLGRNCTIACPRYVPFKCNRRDRSPGACNGCSNYSKCRFDKYWYDASTAEKEYRRELVDARQGVNLTTSEAKAIADVVGPLLNQGISPYSVMQSHPELGICEKTLYNYIESGILKAFGVDAFSLRRQLSRKLPKQKAVQYKKREDRSFLKGRTFKEYKEYIAEHPNAGIVQMDTVYNDVSNGPFIQTFKFKNIPFFFALYHQSKTAADMVSGADTLESILGKNLFNKYVEVLLTDRGGEFYSANDLEFRPDGTRRTRVFYCDPMQSGQKGTLENNHIELRYILPKESDLFALGLTGQKPLDLICAHLNSVPKESLHGKSHFDCLSFFAPDLFKRFMDYGLTVIPCDDILLKPALIKSFRR
ncbi:MAG: IS30 family transposase [Clostridia bacterium]|nr:IS30 family transposase [Clostridia bacterium]